MSKKMKNFVSLSLVLIMSVLVFGSSLVSARENESCEEILNDPVISSESDTYSVRGEDAPASICQRLYDMNVTVEDDSLIEFISSDSTSDGTAIVVTNTEGSTMTKDVVLFIGKDGEVQNLAIEDESSVSPMAGGTIEYPFNEGFAIRATAVYNQRVDSFFCGNYYQPIGVYFFFSNDEDCYVTYVKVDYQCDGFEYSYPGFEMVSDDEYMHVITVEKEFPAVSTMYHTENSYRTDRVICTSSGSLNVGQYLVFTYRLDGKLYTHAYELTSSPGM